MDRSANPAKVSSTIAGNSTMTNHRPLIVFVDVDETFVRSFGSKRIPIVNVLRHIRMLSSQGAVLYCWSTGGAEYAKQSAIEFQIEDCFSGFLPKPSVLIDDQSVSEWRQLVEVDPNEVPADGISGYLALLNARVPSARRP